MPGDPVKMEGNSNMKEHAPFISFSEGRMGDQPVRLDLVEDHPDWIALAKPAGMVVTPDPWYSGRPDLITALRADVAAGKRQLTDLGLVAPVAVNRLDRDESGLLLIAKNEAIGTDLRNRVGSGQLRLTYTLLAEGPTDTEVLESQLPLARHKGQRRMLVSHTTGKKASTQFQRIESFGRTQCWEASTDYGRPHQIRVHGAECELGILGEKIYRKTPLVYLSQLKRRFRRSGKPERPIYDHLALHLSRIELRIPDVEGWLVEAPLPKGFQVLMKRFREFGGR